MGRAWTKGTPTRLGLTSNTGMEFADGADTEGSYIYRRSVSKNTSESEGAV
jgi:hypothetical protein